MSQNGFEAQDWEAIARGARFRPSEMAARCSMSLRQLERHFANRFHMTPGQWTRDLRLRLAQELISQGSSNKIVVAELGFRDSPHLCREFKRRCGTTPQHTAPLRLSRLNPANRTQGPFL